MQYARTRAPLVKTEYFKELEQAYLERYAQDEWLMQAVATQLSARRSVLSLFELAGMSVYAPQLPEDVVAFGVAISGGETPDARRHIDKVCGRVLSNIGSVLREWTYGYLEAQAREYLAGGVEHLRDQAEQQEDAFLLLCLSRERCALALRGLSYDADGHHKATRPVLQAMDEAVARVLAPNVEEAVPPWNARVEQLERSFGVALLDTRWWHLPVAQVWELSDWDAHPQPYLSLELPS